MILFICSCCKTLKTDPSGEICTCATQPKLFLNQIHTLVTDFWLLLLIFKISITVSNWSLIWKHKIYARKSLNHASINQITLKSLTCGEWSSGLRHYRWIGGLLVQTALSPWIGLGLNLVSRPLVAFALKLE